MLKRAQGRIHPNLQHIRGYPFYAPDWVSEYVPCWSGLLYLSWAVHVGGSHGNAAALAWLGRALAAMHSCLLFSQAPERRKHTRPWLAQSLLVKDPR